MKSANRLLGALLGGLSLLCLSESYRLWDGWSSPGTIPIIISIIFSINSMYFLFFSSPDTTKVIWPNKKARCKVLGVGGLFAFYIMSVQYVGYPISTWFFLVAVTKLISLSHVRMHVTIIWTGLVSIFLYIVFNYYLSVYLPSGILWELI
jgi:hypothetical protein